MSNKNSIPQYRKHRQSGQAIVTLPDGHGRRRDILLGQHGTAKSRQEYARVISEWEASGRRLPQASQIRDLTLSELILAYWKHVKEHYRRPDGTQTGEVSEYRRSFRPIRVTYGQMLAKDFGPLALKAIRQMMIDGWADPKRGHQPPLSRGVINQRIGRIRRMFRWAVENEMVPASVLYGLQAVRGLQRGRSSARETEPVKPVPEAFVDATLPYLRPQVAAMVQLELMTGMRPGEVVIMRSVDLDTSGPVWLYRPGSDRGPHGEHKTAWRGHDRIIAIGPRAQDVLKPWLKTDLHAYLFSPREAMSAFREEQRQWRKTKVQPSQQERKKKRPKKRPGDRYTVSSYDKAVAAACKKADTKAHEQHPEIPAEQVIIPTWHPNQLRHTKATEIRREAGLDAARVVLGHRSPQVTETYAEIDLNKAAEVMARLG